MKSPSAVPERILITGIYGAGKTEVAVSWAAAMRKAGEGRCWWVNTDIPGTVQRVNERYDDWESNITFTDVGDWESLADATDTFRSLMKPGDLLVVDSADKTWTWIRDLYDYTQADRKGTLPKAGDWFGVIEEVDDMKRWDPINTAYQRWVMPILDPARCPAHVVLISPAQPIKVATEKSNWSDDKGIISEFGKFGVRPAGNKHLTYQFHTVLLMEHGRGGYTMTTMKDRSREYADKMPLSESFPFTAGYLMGLAGWEL